MNDSLREILIADLPPSFVTRFIAAAAWAYQEAWDQCQNNTLLLDDGKMQLLPHLRRLLLEAKLQEIALDSGLRAESEPVISGAYKYVAVRSGRLVITCSKTTGPNAVPKSCDFREQYSDINEHIDQQNLFPVISNPGKDSLYGIIIHGPGEKEMELGFCCLGFPSQDMNSWAQAPIALADVRDYQQQRYQKPTDDRSVIQEVEPKLKPKFDADDDSAEETAS